MAFGGQGVDGIDHKVVAGGIEQLGDILVLEENGQNGELHLGVDVAETGGEDFDLGLPQRGVQGRKLAVDVGGLDGVGIDQRQATYPRTAKHFGRIGSHTSHTNDQYMSLVQAFTLFFAQQQARTLFPVFHQFSFLNHL